jgi:nucleotide-binding universal stress UspA family protein
MGRHEARFVPVDAKEAREREKRGVVPNAGASRIACTVAHALRLRSAACFAELESVAGESLATGDHGRSRAMSSFHHILAPVDFGDATGPALDLALSLARASDARLTLLHAFDVTPFANASPFVPVLDTKPVIVALEREMDALREKTALVWSKTDALVRTGDVYEVILDEAQRSGCDLIVLGTHGRRGLSHALLGSVAERVVRLSPIPVLTVRPTTSSPKKG